MKYPGDLAQGLVEELLEVIHRYDESMIFATALGCLDIVKAQLIQDHMEDDDD